MKLRFVPNLLILPLFAFGFFGIAHARSGDASALLKMESEFQKATAEKGWDGYVTFLADDSVELPTRPGRICADSQSAPMTQMTWPVLTVSPGATESSETRPDRCACTSFSIFIASTTQIT